jgi:hypothetical protein
MKSTLGSLMLASLLIMPWVAASAADNTQFDVLKDMSVADYRATGLDKLSDAQIKALNAWFANYQSQHAKDCGQTAAVTPAAVPAVAASKPATTTSRQHKVDGSIVTSSRIDGKFTGWYGSTVFKLQNGQTWEQTDNQMMTIAAMQNPEVTITKGAFNVYYLEVQGLVNSVQVRQVKPDDLN